MLDFDEWGRYRFRSRRHGAQLSAIITDGVFYATDYTGPSESILALFAAGLARIPCIEETEVSWFDCVGSVMFRSGAARWLLDMVEPFFGPFLLRFQYRMKPEHGGGFAMVRNT